MANGSPPIVLVIVSSCMLRQEILHLYSFKLWSDWRWKTNRPKFWNVLFVLMEERYEPLREMGSDNFRVARLVRDKNTNELVAIKYIERGKKVNDFSMLLLPALDC